MFDMDITLAELLLKSFNLVPGEDSMPAEFHYEPANPNDTVAEVCVANFILN